MFYYFVLGVAVVLLLHFFLKWMSKAPTRHVKWVGGTILLLVLVVGVILLLRIGQAPLAALYAGIMVLLPWLRRVLFGVNLYRKARHFRRKPGSVSDGRMQVKQAREVLGLAEDADREAILRAHRELMRKLHPDAGGTEYLAKQLNEARDVLLEALDDRH